MAKTTLTTPEAERLRVFRARICKALHTFPDGSLDSMCIKAEQMRATIDEYEKLCESGKIKTTQTITTIIEKC